MAERRIMIVGAGGGFGRVLTSRFLQAEWRVDMVDLEPPVGPVPDGVRLLLVSASAHELGIEVRTAVLEADAVLLATPLRTIPRLLPLYAEAMREGTLIADIGSVKMATVAALQALPRKDLEAMSIHPLFGPAVDFDGQNLTVTGVRVGPRAEHMLRLFETWGCRIMRLSAEEHDRLMAFNQALCHASLLALAAAAGDLDLAKACLLQATTPTSRTMLGLFERIASGDPDLYTSIQMENHFAAEAVRAFVGRLNDLAHHVAERDDRSLVEFIRHAAAWWQVDHG